eukprot:Gregarina_sp_Poly_1__6147@NODE_324_length_9523_cov_66_749683_g276_i0_p3_GENE_NODE_324_length_9523_cov_66_749683_g276_i0NODE_324_length_9523_cov_66_749683_g276_i0_p3_ORF_typecomplete_len527_score45_93HA2/PF04408_23/0_0088_NODE_324_length_9523_cov_66_749683_g276_i027044284
MSTHYMEQWNNQVEIYFTSRSVDDYIEGVCATAIQLNEESLKQSKHDCVGARGAFLLLLPTNEDVRLVYKIMTRYAKHWNNVIGNRDRYPELQITKHPAGEGKILTSRNFKWPNFSHGRFIREMGVINVELFDSKASSRELMGGVSAIVDPGLGIQRMCHPCIPMTITYEGLVPCTHQQVLARTKKINVALSPRKQAAYYLLMTEAAFENLNDLPFPDSASKAKNVVRWLDQMQEMPSEMPRYVIPCPIIERGLEYLYMCGLIDDEGHKIKPTYTRFLQWFELLEDANLARLMLLSTERRFSCVLECAAISAMLKKCPHPFVDSRNLKSSRDIAWHRLSQMTFSVKEGDLISLMNIMQASILHENDSRWFSEHMLRRRDLLDARAFMLELLEVYRKIHQNENDPIPTTGDNSDVLMKIITAAFFQNLVFRQVEKSEPNYLLWRELRFPDITKSDRVPVWCSSRNIELRVSRTCCFHLGSYNDWPDVAVFYGLTGISGAIELSTLTPTKFSWLTELMPHVYEIADRV